MGINKELVHYSVQLGKPYELLFMVTPCINDIEHFIVQLMHTYSLLKQIKIKKAAPTCFGLQGNHHQGATVSA